MQFLQRFTIDGWRWIKIVTSNAICPRALVCFYQWPKLWISTECIKKNVNKSMRARTRMHEHTHTHTHIHAHTRTRTHAHTYLMIAGYGWVFLAKTSKVGYTQEATTGLNTRYDNSKKEIKRVDNTEKRMGTKRIPNWTIEHWNP